MATCSIDRPIEVDAKQMQQLLVSLSNPGKIVAKKGRGRKIDYTMAFDVLKADVKEGGKSQRAG